MGQVPPLAGIRRRRSDGPARELRRRPGEPHRPDREHLRQPPHLRGAPAAGTREPTAGRFAAPGRGALPQWRDQRDRRRARPDRNMPRPAARSRNIRPGLRRTSMRSSVLLGMPPANLGDLLQPDSGISEGAGRGCDRHSGGSVAQATGHPQRRAAGRRRVGADRRDQGAALPRVLAQRQLRLCLERHRRGEPLRCLQVVEPHGVVRSGGVLEPVQLRPDHQPGPRAGRELPGGDPVLPEHRAAGAAGGRGCAGELLGRRTAPPSWPRRSPRASDRSSSRWSSTAKAPPTTPPS